MKMETMQEMQARKTKEANEAKFIPVPEGAIIIDAPSSWVRSMRRRDAEFCAQVARGVQ